MRSKIGSHGEKPETGNEKLEEAAARIEVIAREIELARKHLETTALRFRQRDPARAGAHGYAAFGHLTKALTLLESEAQDFATHSEPAPVIDG